MARKFQHSFGLLVRACLCGFVFTFVSGCQRLDSSLSATRAGKHKRVAAPSTQKDELHDKDHSSGGAVFNSPGAFMTYYLLNRFTEDEIRSKSWTAGRGTKIELIEYAGLIIEDRPNLIVVKYGDTRTGAVYCVDFYEEGGTYSGQKLPLFLVCHDAREGVLAGVAVRKQAGRVYLDIQRLISDQKSGKSRKHVYSYEYLDGPLMLPGIGD